MLAERQWTIDGRRLNLAVGPEHGPPLVLLHGVVRRWQDFVPLVPALSARWQLFAVDFRGHGQSAATAEGYLVVDYVRDIVALLQREVQQPAVLFGHSLGAMVAGATAAEVPQWVRAAVLEDPPFHTMGTQIQKTPYYRLFVAFQSLAGSPRSVPELAQEMADLELLVAGERVVRLGDVRDAASLRFSASCLRQLDPRVLEPIVAGRWIDGYDQRQIAGRIACPTLILQADEKAGGVLSQADALALESGIRDATRVYFPGAGHLLHTERTEATLRAAIGFLESLRGLD